MIGLSYEQIISKIQTEKGISQTEIEEKIKSKLNQLSDLISKEGAAHIIANELGVKLFEAPQARRFKIKDLSPILRNVEIIAKVLNKWDVREFKTEKREGRVASMFVGDETGKLRVTIWDENVINDFANLKEGDIIKISSGYMRENNGYPELHLGSGSKLFINPEGEKVEAVAERTEVNHKAIKDLAAGDFVKIAGTVVQVFEPRFYEACPECNKKVDETGNCGQHGPVTAVTVPIINIYFDDGTDNIRVVLFREAAVKFLGVEADKVSELKNPEEFNKVKNGLLGKQLKLTGKVNKNEMFGRLEFSANSIDEAKPQEIAAELVR